MGSRLNRFCRFIAGETIFGALLLAVVCIAVQHSPHLLSKFVSLPVTFERIGTGSWKAQIESIPEGSYYVSLGRPKGNCSISTDGRVLDSNKSAIPGIRQELLVGGSFLKNVSGPKAIDLECDVSKGFKIELGHPPILARYEHGLMLQLWRGVVDFLLGPAFSLALLFFIIIQLRGPSGQPAPATYLTFSVSAVLYSFSLSHFPRLFVDGLTASFVHVVLRICFSWAFVLLVGSYSKQRFFLTLVHVGVLALTLFTGITSPGGLDPVYRGFYPVFALVTAISVLDLYRIEARIEAVKILRVVAVIWLFTQTVDTYFLVQGKGFVGAPMLLVFMSAAIAYARHKEKLRSDRVQAATTRILSAINSKSTLSEILTQIASIASGATHFTRVSAYIDGFCIGIAEHPRRIFARVMESGYRKDTDSDKRIPFQEGRGSFMSLATETEQVVLRKGARDGAFFLVVPIGKHACVNLSDDSSKSPYLAYESEDIVRQLLPSLKALNARVLAQGFRQGAALERFRSLRGDGRFEVELGAIFADVSDYSVLSDRYGISYSDFINAVYFPAMIKALSSHAVPESMRGDEVYLIVFPELLSEEKSTAVALIEALYLLRSFIYGPGAQLCRDNGFDPIEMSIGAAVGAAVLVCDPIQVRTAGTTINDAKRLQEAAGRGCILIRSEGLDTNRFPGLLEDKIPVLVKKNFIVAHRVRASHLREVA